MKLTFKNKIKLCFEILTIKEKDEKGLSTFIRGYVAGMKDEKASNKCVRIGYDLYECDCDKCIELDTRRQERIK